MDIITYALAKKIGSPSEAQIESAVDNYLDAHPEATTTVQDGSITKAKLNAELSGKVDEISDINERLDDLKEDLNYAVKHDRTQIVNQERFISGTGITPTLTYNNDGFTSVLPSSANCMYGFSFDTTIGKTYNVDVVVSAGPISALYAVNGTSPSTSTYLDKIEDVTSGNTGTLSFSAISDTTTIWIYQAYNVNTITVSSISIDNGLSYNNMDDTLTSTKAPAPAKTVGDRLRAIPDDEWLTYNNLFQITSSDLVTNYKSAVASVTRTISENNITIVTSGGNVNTAYQIKGLDIGTDYILSFTCSADMTSGSNRARLTINATENSLGNDYAAFEKSGDNYSCVFRANDFTLCLAIPTAYDSGTVVFENIQIKKQSVFENRYCNYIGEEITSFNKCLCIGDSLTYGGFNATGVDPDVGIAELANKYSYPTYLQKKTGINVTKVATGGVTSVTWWNMYQNEDLSGYDMAIIQLGVNDGSPSFYGGWTQASIDAFTNIINKLKTENKGIKIFVATTVPAPAYYDSYRLEVSEGIRELVESLDDSNVVLADINRYGHTYDSIGYSAGHLTAFGYNRLAQDYISLISYLMHKNPEQYRFIQFIGTNYTYSN